VDNRDELHPLDCVRVPPVAAVLAHHVKFVFFEMPIRPGSSKITIDGFVEEADKFIVLNKGILTSTLRTDSQ
jgi:hypothetical protein